MARNLQRLTPPLLIGIYPVLFLWSANLGQVAAAAVLPSLFLSLGFSAAALLVFLGITRDTVKGSLLAGLFLLLFFLYGNIYQLVGGQTAAGIQIGFVKLLALFAALFAILAIWILRVKYGLERLYPILNLVFGALVLVALLRIGVYEARAASWEKIFQAAEPQTVAADKNLPDVYFIVIDGYARSDILRDRFSFDNSAFLAGLRERGFYVVDCAFSNYPKTALSIASTLNMTYVEDLGLSGAGIYTNDSPPELQKVIHQSQSRMMFASHGFRFASFRGFFPINDIQDSDIYFEFFEDQQWSNELAARNFGHMFLQTTLLRAFLEYYQLNPYSPLWANMPFQIYTLLNPDTEQFSSRSYQWYRQHLFTFDTLESIPDMPGKKFVYAHIYATHQPYVMRSDGSFLWPINEDNFSYVQAVEYVSQRMLRVIDEILRKSDVPPVIILQADHGFDLPGMDRNKILNALYLPNGRQDLYPTITPVNSLRLVLRDYFGEPYDLLPDDVIVIDPAGEATRVPARCGEQP